MKPHLPVLLRKALFACFAFSFTCSASSAADLSLGVDDTLTIDYADADSILDLAGGSLQLAGDTVLVLSNCGEGDGKTYTLVTGVGSLLDTAGNAIALDATNNEVARYFDINQPGTGFWADALLMLAADGSLQLVRHDQPVSTMAPITSRQTGGANYQYGAAVSFENIQYESSSYAYGGAIYGNSSITLSNNGSVNFIGNTASSSTQACGGAIYGYYSTITLSGNGSVSFSGNTASTTGGSTYSASGGAIAGSTITLSGNGSVSFIGNTASTTGSFYPARGGAIDGGGSSTITLSGNGSVSFIGNTASTTGSSFSATGGAIFGGSSSTITLSGNGSVSFSGNAAIGSSSASGGAIEMQPGVFSIQNNTYVVFENNYTISSNALRLQSIYAFDLDQDGRELNVDFSVPKGGKLEFRDSIYINVGSNSASAFHLNDWYENDAGVKVVQTGDIIFTGADATAEYLGNILVKHGLTATDEQMSGYIAESRRSEINGVAQLHDGRLIIRDGAVWDADGISVLASASGESTPTLWLHHGELTRLYSLSGNNALTFAGGTAFELSGQNKVSYSNITLASGSSLVITLDATHATTAALTLASSTLQLPTSGAVTLKLQASVNLEQGQSYALLSGLSKPTGWDSSSITVTSGTSGWDVDWNDLSWVDDTLWLYYDTRPDLVTATWTNEEDDGLWNMSSLNWEQNDINYEYKDDVDVVFGDEGAGTVTLVGTITPKSVLVDSAEDYTWEADTTSGGKLTGAMALTKQGEGSLTINTENDYTGGTTIKAGSIVVESATALGLGMVLLNGGTLEIANGNFANELKAEGNSAIIVQSGTTWYMSSVFSNSGTLSITGTLDATGVGALTDHGVTYTKGNGNGFKTSSAYSIQLVDNSGTINSTATIKHGDIELILGQNGMATAEGTTDFTTYYITEGHEATVNTIRGESGGALSLIDMTGGTLKVNEDAAVKVTGGSINQTSGVLSGSISGAMLSISGGTLTATLEGTNTLSGDNKLFNVLDNDGTLNISGTLDVTGVGALTDHGVTYTKGGSNGFKTSSAYSIQLVDNSGTINSTATIKHGDIELILGQNGMATAEGTTDYTTYYITAGHEATVNTIRGESGGALSLIDMTGGSLKVNEDAVVKVTGGNVNQTSGVLSGSISDAMLSISGGTLTATLGGTNTLSGDNKLSNVLDNDGTLNISGTLDVSGVGELTDHGVTYTKGNGNGFKTSSAYSIQLVDNSGTINSTATIKHGDIELILGQNGMATAEGTTDFTTYYITAGHEATVNTIRGESGGALSLIDMTGGTLKVNEDAVVKVFGGNVNQTSGVLSGSISDAMLSISGGTLAATLEGTNTLSGDNKLFNVLDNDGTLNISGTLDVTGVGALTDHGVTYTKGGSNGFKTSSAYSIQLVDNSGTINSTATIKHGDIELILGQNGMATAEGTTDFTTYYITAGHEATVNTIRGESGGALSLIDMTGGTLKVNEDAAVKVSGGNVNQTSGVLSGSISGAMLSISGGTLTATLGGTNTLSGDNKLFNVLDNDGTLNISGTLDVTGVGALTDHGVTYTKGGNNGFKTSSSYSIQLVDNSGTINSTATIKHGDIELVLGQNGMATAEGTTDYTTYYITAGHEATVNTIRGESGGALSLIDMTGGTLKVNEDAVVKVTGGNVNQTSGVLSGSISDAMLSISGGTLTATLEGTNTLSGDNKLFNVLDNDGTLNISGKIDVSALQLISDAEGRVGLNGQAVLMSESGFAKAVSYRVTVIDNAGTLVGYEHVEIVHNGTSETLTLQGNGEATGGGTIDYTHLYVENDDHFVISEVEATTGVNLSMVTMDSGVLEVDQSVAVDATGGHISITKDAVLSGAVTDAAVSTSGGTYISEISAQLKGDTTLVVNGGTITVSGDNSYTGGTTVNGGTLVAGYDKAFGTGDVEVNNATLDLKQFSVANKVAMSGNSTLGHAEGASHIVLRRDSQVNFREGYTLGSGKVLEVAGDSTYRGALTLSGGTLALSGKLTVQGDVEFAAGATTTIDVSGWTGLNDGDVLADLGSASHGYVDGCLTLNGIIGDWTLKFDDATGVLTLQTVKEETFSPDLTRNQQVVYDTIKKIMGKSKPDGLLGVLGKDVVSTHDEKALKKLLQAMSGEEYTTMMSSQIEGNQARMRRLRSAAGSAHPQVPQYGMGLYVNAFNNDADVESDASGPGYSRMEWGANVGVEARIEQNTILGLGLEKSRARVTPNGASRYHEEATRLDAYMVHETGSWRMMGAVGMGEHRYDLRRTLPNGDKTEAESMNGSSVNVMAELAYTLNLAEQHVLQPFFVLESSYNKIDAFEEEGAGSASLRGDSRQAWATDVTLGMRYTYSFATVSGAPAASLTIHSGVVLSVGDTTDELNLRFAGAEDERFTLNGANRNRWGYNVGVFVSLPLNETTSVFGSAESLLRGDTTQYDAQIGVRVAF